MAIYSKIYFSLHPPRLPTSLFSREEWEGADWIATFSFALHKTMAVIISLSSWGQQQWAHSVTQPPTYLAKYWMSPLEGLGVLGPHVEHTGMFLEMLSTLVQHVLLCSTFSCVCVMDGLLTDSSNANIGLPACTGSGSCKLNLSALFPPPLINSLTLDCVCRLAGWFPPI